MNILLERIYTYVDKKLNNYCTGWSSKMEHVLLSPQQKVELQRACSRINFTDFGRWLGSGPAPNCDYKQNLKRKITINYQFPTDESANRWNLEMEQAIRIGGHSVTALLTLGVGAIKSVGAAAVVGWVASAGKDEAQAIINYPRMARGWAYTLEIQYSYTWALTASSFPLVKAVKGVSTNHEGVVVDTRSKRVTFSNDDVSDEYAVMLASGPDITKNITY